MPHIELAEDLPGIRGLMAFRPETAGPLNALAEVLLRSQNTLSRGERELIGAYVSNLNDCDFCSNVHSAMASHYLSCDIDLVAALKRDMDAAPISDKMKALLAIAGAVQLGGKHVRSEQVDRAKQCGASDEEIHDTVLIAAAFCMFNRYVDGLDTRAPVERQFYSQRASQRALEGYAGYNPLENTQT